MVILELRNCYLVEMLRSIFIGVFGITDSSAFRVFVLSLHGNFRAISRPVTFLPSQFVNHNILCFVLYVVVKSWYLNPNYIRITITKLNNLIMHKIKLLSIKNFTIYTICTSTCNCKNINRFILI
jgi:hypothetical protein